MQRYSDFSLNRWVFSLCGKMSAKLAPAKQQPWMYPKLDFRDWPLEAVYKCDKQHNAAFYFGGVAVAGGKCYFKNRVFIFYR